jgi:hypothetical protein
MRSYRSARIKREVRYEEQIPEEGNWATVKEASEITGRSRTHIYMMIFQGKYNGFRLVDGPLYVEVDSVK